MNDNQLSNILDIKNYRRSFIESFDTNDIELQNKLDLNFRFEAKFICIKLDKSFMITVPRLVKYLEVLLQSKVPFIVMVDDGEISIDPFGGI